MRLVLFFVLSLISDVVYGDVPQRCTHARAVLRCVAVQF